MDLVAVGTGRVFDTHAVEIHLGARLTMKIATDLRGVAAANIAEAGKAGGERHEVIDILCAGRQRLEQLVRHHLLPADVLHVDQRGLPRYRNRLLDGPNSQVRGSPWR